MALNFERVEGCKLNVKKVTCVRKHLGLLRGL